MEIKKDMNKYAIVVLYEPDITNIKRLCKSIIGQGFKVILVDNSERAPLLNNFELDNCILISNKQNKGIAYAQNIGIKYALSYEADIITFFDQDSIVPNGLLANLSEPLLLNRLCITVPIPVEKWSGMEYPSQRLNKFGWPFDVFSKDMKEPVNVDIVISSGMTTSADVIKLVGYFDEDFFIDFVDIEWCFRNMNNRIPLYVVPEARMEHSIGDKTITFGPISVVMHSPIRTYYKVRNTFLLFRKKINILFVLRQVIPALIHNFLLIFFVKNKCEYFSYYIKGIMHGIVGRVGKL
jgi:rhamnosyltransferase